jgi:hypothetical protein
MPCIPEIKTYLITFKNELQNSRTMLRTSQSQSFKELTPALAEESGAETHTGEVDETKEGELE